MDHKEQFCQEKSDWLTVLNISKAKHECDLYKLTLLALHDNALPSVESG